MHPAPAAVTTVKAEQHDSSCPFFTPGPDTGQGQGPRRPHFTVPYTDSELLTAGVAEYTKGAEIMESVQKQMQTNEQNIQKLLDLYLYKEDRQRKYIKEQMAAMREERRLRELGVLQAKPCTSREQPQAPQSTPQAAAASQDPAILDIQPSVPSPTSTDSSSVPSLTSLPGAAAAYDSDCEITGHIPPKRKRTAIKCEPSDSDMLQLTGGAQNRLL